MTAVAGVCRDCDLRIAAGDTTRRCHRCGSPRLLRHPRLFDLTIAHIDCDAFFASVEKRDRPELKSRPVIVGGGHRGVVSTACYVARQYGVRSAMPMFKALAACPDAVVIRPDHEKYSRAGREVRALMQVLTPLVEPVSIDEAYLDLSGTQTLHGAPPAIMLARLARQVEAEVGVTVSVGLASNRFLAKLASDMDKPRGFAVLSEEEAPTLLAPKPVIAIHGVGPAMARALAAHGIRTIADLQAARVEDLVRHHGAFGLRLAALAFGRDERRIEPHQPAKSISAETTFAEDLDGTAALKAQLWPLCEKVAARMKRKQLTGRTITLKLKDSDFHTVTRSHSLAQPSQLAETLFAESVVLLERALADAPGRRWRLIGTGFSDLHELADTDDLFAGAPSPAAAHAAEVEAAIDAVRRKLGDDAIFKGRSLASRREGP